MKTDLWILGAGGLGREYRAMIEHCPQLNARYKIRAFVDDAPPAEMLDGVPVLSGVRHALSGLSKGSAVTFAIGDARVRAQLIPTVSDLPIFFSNASSSVSSIASAWNHSIGMRNCYYGRGCAHYGYTVG